LLRYDSSKLCTCPLNKFIGAFKVVKLFFSNTLYGLSYLQHRALLELSSFIPFSRPPQATQNVNYFRIMLVPVFRSDGKYVSKLGSTGWKTHIRGSISGNGKILVFSTVSWLILLSNRHPWIFRLECRNIRFRIFRLTQHCFNICLLFYSITATCLVVRPSSACT
jgi:hypothetical protein